jgi:ArsR family metal-binding transcriptional regulator
MLLRNYTIEMVRPTCNASFQSLHCHAHLEEDISEVIPYLNAVLGGTCFVQSPPSVMFKVHGRMISVHSQKISINALKDAEEAMKIVEWLKREINEAWEKRASITPKYSAVSRPQPLAVLKLLPKTNCGQCGQATCIVFASLAVQGAMGPDACPALDGDHRKMLAEYLGQFNFEEM